MGCGPAPSVRGASGLFSSKNPDRPDRFALVHEVKASLIRSSGMVWVMSGSIAILPSMYQSTIFGTSVRPRAPKAEPRHTRPVTSWSGRMVISVPDGATPMMIDSP